MIKQKFKIKFLGIFLMVCSIVLSMCIPILANNNESYDYTYLGVEKYGENDGDDTTALLKVSKNDGTKYVAYCIDESNYTKDNQKYSLVNVEDADYYNIESANKIKNIVINSYPYITIENLKTLSGIKTLTDTQAIAGSQAAIWHYSNSEYKTQIKGNSKLLYDWYLKLPELSNDSAKVSDIDIKQETNIVNGKYEVTILYKATQKNSDGTDISLQYNFDKDLKNEYGAQIEETVDNQTGYNIVKISNLNKNAKFNVYVSGNQKLKSNAYFYMPKGGRTAAQALVSVRSDQTSISNSKDINLSLEGYTLTLNKIDAQDLTGIPNVEFKIASDSEFKNNVKTVKTGSNGKVDVEGLTKGIWYVKETKAPDGYIPNTDVTQIYINEADIQLDIKNSKYGKAEIVKIDENNNPVQNAKFTLYKDNVNDNNIISSDLTSDVNGKIEIKDLMPGTYMLVETQTPDDYILNNEIIKFDVEAYKTTTVTHVNETKGFATIKICKKDAVTKQQLAGCKIGIYSDSAYKNLIMEIETKEDETVDISSLRPGTYYLKETKAPDGYLLDSAPKQLTINKNDVAEVEFYNSKNYSTAGNYLTPVFIGGLILTIGLTGLVIKKKAKNIN